MTIAELLYWAGEVKPAPLPIRIKVSPSIRDDLVIDLTASEERSWKDLWGDLPMVRKPHERVLLMGWVGLHIMEREFPKLRDYRRD